MWVRGLKRKGVENAKNVASVAPYVGAWIETPRTASAIQQQAVAPYVGAWIETINNVNNMSPIESHPMWVRGLKLLMR